MLEPQLTAHNGLRFGHSRSRFPNSCNAAALSTEYCLSLLIIGGELRQSMKAEAIVSHGSYRID